ncbi:MAG: hypothetical protein P8Y78_10025 [Acidihalobacter sp.]|jgi:hypothetical protein
MANNCKIDDFAGKVAECHGVNRLGRLTIDATVPNEPIQAKLQPHHF